MKYRVSTVGKPTGCTTDDSGPLTPDQLLEKDNESSAVEKPPQFLTSMSERRVHVSTLEGSAVPEITAMAKDLVQTSSFMLPADTFLGRLGEDGRHYGVSWDSTAVVRAPNRPRWQERI